MNSKFLLAGAMVAANAINAGLIDLEGKEDLKITIDRSLQTVTRTETNKHDPTEVSLLFESLIDEYTNPTTKSERREELRQLIPELTRMLQARGELRTHLTPKLTALDIANEVIDALIIESPSLCECLVDEYTNPTTKSERKEELQRLIPKFVRIFQAKGKLSPNITSKLAALDIVHEVIDALRLGLADQRSAQ